MNNLFKIYPLQNYKTLEKTFNKNVVEGTIDEIIEKLKSNKGYNIRVNPDKPCLVYGDFDHCTQEEFNNFLKVISDEFESDINEISYTESIKPNEYSYHWSIPSLKISSPEKLKKVFKQDKYKTLTKNIDLSVYTTHFLRLPNQTNKDKPLEHKIINGKMEDFIIEYVSKTKYTFNFEDEDEEQLIETTIQKPKIKDDHIINEIKNCLLCLDPTLYEDWMKVALIINNELGGAGLDILHEWSEQSEKYNYDSVTSFYNNIKPKDNGLKIGSLKKMAKEENPTLYKKLFYNKEDKDFKIDYVKEWSTGYLGEIFKSLYNQFIYSNGFLYHFNSIYWKTDDNNKSIIHNFVDGTFHNDLLDKLYDYDKNTNDKNDEHIKIINSKRKYISTLRNISTRQKLIEDIIKKITNNDIEFDDEPYLFAFENKIFDLKIGEFVQPKPEQYISITTGYKYIDDYDFENKRIELDKLLNSIFPEPELKKLYLTILSTGLDGVPLEKFVLANGSGGNGKGLLNEFVQNMLGNYSYVLPVNILLGPLKQGTNPEIANMNNKRFVIAREPDRNLLFNCATIKEFTGGTELNARLCFSNKTKVNLKLSMILECNDKPKLNESNDALGRRIIDIPFKNKFVDRSTYDELDEEDKKTTFLINSYYKTNEFKKEYRQALFLILVEHFKEYYKNKLELPLTKEIIQRNKDYLKSSDELLNWIDDIFEKTNNTKDVIKLKVVYEAFKNSDYFNNLNKIQKRQNNYKHFIEKLKNNMFLKKYVKENSDNVYILTSYKLKDENNNEDNDEDNDQDI